VEIKEKIDLNKTLVDIIHKKILILLGGVAGSWFYGLEFTKSENTLLYMFGVIVFLLFIFLGFGIILNYLKLSRLEDELEELKNG
jgi:ABC-type spermidine/putrescine transport system permease subunit I